MSKILDLDAYRKKIKLSGNDEDVIQTVVDDACRELIENAVWVAKDLGVDITTMEFCASLSGAYHYYAQALEIGLGLRESNQESHVLSEDVTEWINFINTEGDTTDE